jgi:hypothetical protein
MKRLHLRYAGWALPLTGVLQQTYLTQAATLRDLVDELTGLYAGFHQVFIDDRLDKMKLNVMVYYGLPGKADVPVIDLDFQILDEARITFW